MKKTVYLHDKKITVYNILIKLDNVCTIFTLQRSKLLFHFGDINHVELIWVYDACGRKVVLFFFFLFERASEHEIGVEFHNLLGQAFAQSVERIFSTKFEALFKRFLNTYSVLVASFLKKQLHGQPVFVVYLLL